MTTPDALRDAEHIANVPNLVDDPDDGPSSSNPRGGPQVSGTEIRASRKIVLLDRLRRDLDIIVYCELSTLYYMDCSIIPFVIRGVTQLLFFTPKPGPIPETPAGQPYVGAILLSNLACILFHLLLAQPTPSEASRGYIHGGILMDFVGQHGPISKFSLLTFDILVLILQLIMMGIVQERAKTNQLLPREASASEDTATSDISNGQDHDLEERGVRQTDTQLRHGHSSEDIELQDIPLSSSDSNGEAEDNERNELLAEPAEGSQIIDASAHPLDAFYSGESVIMDMHFIRTIKDQWRAAGSQETSAYTSSRSYPATLFGGRFRIEMTSNRENTGSV